MSNLAVKIGLITGLFLLSSCNQKLYINANAFPIFNPKLDISEACPSLRLTIAPQDAQIISRDFSAADISKIEPKTGYVLIAYPFHIDSQVLSPKTTLQCIKDGVVIGESVRSGRPSNDAQDKNFYLHISAPKVDQAYVGDYASRTGIAPVIEIGPEITVNWK